MERCQSKRMDLSQCQGIGSPRKQVTLKPRPVQKTNRQSKFALDARRYRVERKEHELES